MKIAMTLLVAGLLVVTASAASAAARTTTTPAGTWSAHAVPATVIGSSVLADADQGCGASSAPLISTADPTMAPIEQSGGLICGSCSQNGCGGKDYNSPCIANAKPGICTDNVGPFYCSDGNVRCVCLTSPVP